MSVYGRMDEFKSSVNTLDEIKKLQDLVRQLEIQNLQLRNKKDLKRSAYDLKQKNCCTGVQREKPPEISTSKLKDEYFEDLEIIRVSDIEMSDDESWLYTSPKSAKQDVKNENSYKWIRKDVDDPENKQLQFAKRALLTKLNELEILSPGYKKPARIEHSALSNSRRAQIMHTTLQSAQSADSLPIDSRTFTRSKKKQAMEYLENLDLLSNQKLEKRNSFKLSRRESDVSFDSLSNCHILEDANDVQEVARMQEESLRMSSPLSTSNHGSVSSCEMIHNISCQEDWVPLSDQSSPSGSPYGSNASLSSAGKTKGHLGTYRSSLPNLNRNPLTFAQSKGDALSNSSLSNQAKRRVQSRKNDSTDPSLIKKERDVTSARTKQSNHMTSYPSTIQSSGISEPQTAVPKTVSASESKQRSRSGLPRASRASSASRCATRSGIPMPSSVSKHPQEDSWNDGCF